VAAEEEPLEDKSHMAAHFSGETKVLRVPHRAAPLGTLGVAICLLHAMGAVDTSESPRGDEAMGATSMVCMEGDTREACRATGGEAGGEMRACGPGEHAVGRWVALPASQRAIPKPGNLNPNPKTKP